MIYGKSELLKKLSDIARKGWSNTHIRDLIDTLWREPNSMRTAGFYYAGGNESVIDLIPGFDEGEGSGSGDDVYSLTFTIDPEEKKYTFYQRRGLLTYHRKFETELATVPCTEGLHYIYFDFDPVSKEEILYVTSPPYVNVPTFEFLMVHRCMVASVYYDAEKMEAIVFNDQRYGSEWNPQMHKTIRNTLGSLRDFGLAFTDLTADDEGDEDIHAQFGISAGAVWHGDIYKTSAGVARGTGIPIMYFNTADNPRIIENPGWAVKWGSLLQYQKAGEMTDAQEEYFVLYHIFATNCLYNEFISVPGIAEYEKLADAGLAMLSELEDVKELLPYTDFLHIGTLIFQTSAAFTNAAHSRIVSYSFTVFTEMSVQGNGNPSDKIKLVNDQETPPAGTFYGAHYETAEKGFHGIDPRLMGSGQMIYLHSEDSDLTGYKQALTTQPEDAMATYTAAAAVADGDVLIEEFATQADYPGVTVIPAGPWIFNYWVAVGSGTQSSIVVKVYKRIAAGTETELLTFTQAVTVSVAAEQFNAVPMAQVELLATDRLVVKYYHRNAGAISATMYLFAEGNAVAEWKWSGFRIPLAPAGGGGSVTDVFVEQDPQFPIEYLKYTKDGVDYDVTSIAKANGLIWGGFVSWVELLTFSVTPVLYYLFAVLKKILDTTIITLDAADPDNPRIDVIAVDNTEAVIVIKGTPAENPQKPSIDPETQIELTYVLIPAGATEPQDIDQSVIYDENTEWTGAGSGVTVDFDNATTPFHNSKCASVGSITNNDTVTFTTGVPVDVTDFKNLILYLKLKAAMTSQHNLYAAWMRSGALVSNEVVLAISKSNITDWQSIAIQLTAFTWSQSTVDALRLRWSKSGPNVAHAGFYLDFVKLETGIIQQVVNSAIILTGDVTGSGVTGSPVPTTLATVNANVGQFGDATNVPKITVDGKGRVTAIENVAVTIPPAITPTSDALPVDTDEVVSLRGTSWLKTTWTVLKAFLKTYFDNVYAAINHAHTFLSLTDTPANYTGSGGKMVAVNSGATALEFVDAPSGGGAMSIIDHSTGAFTLALTDAENYLTCNYPSGFAVTVPKNSVVAFPVGTTICLEQTGNGAITMSPVDVDVTLVAYDGLTSYGQYAVLTLVKKATDTWTVIAGTGF